MDLDPPPAPPYVPPPPAVWKPLPQAPPIQQPQHREGFLRIRGANSLNEKLTISTTCPTSMEWLIYLKSQSMALPTSNFDLNITFIGDEEAPSFVFEGAIYHDVNQLNDYHTSLSLGPRLISEEVRHKKDMVMDALTVVRDCYWFGYGSLCDQHTQYVTAAVIAIRKKLDLDNDEQIETELLERMEDACQILSKELGENTYFLDSLRKTLDDHTSGTDMTSLSILDVQQAALTILIMNCFKTQHAPRYNLGIHEILHRHISIWAHADIIYSWFIKEKSQSWGSRIATVVLTLKTSKYTKQIARRHHQMLQVWTYPTICISCS